MDAGQGVGEWQGIVTLLFRYLELVRASGHQEWMHNELKVSECPSVRSRDGKTIIDRASRKRLEPDLSLRQSDRLLPCVWHQAIAEMEYRYQEETDTSELVEGLAAQLLPMYHYGELVLQGPYLLWDWRPDLIDAVLSCLTPTAMRIDLLSSTFGRAGDLDHPEDGDGLASPEGVTVVMMETDASVPSPSPSLALPPETLEKEPRFGTHFCRERLAVDLLKEWGGPWPEPHPRLALPRPNPFVTTDLSVKEVLDGATVEAVGLGPEVEAALDELEASHPELAPVLEGIRKTPPKALPALVVEEPGLKVWHLQDRVFRMPRSEVFIKLATPVAYSSARNEAMTDMIAMLVKDSLRYVAGPSLSHPDLVSNPKGYVTRATGSVDK